MASVYMQEQMDRITNISGNKLWFTTQSSENINFLTCFFSMIILKNLEGKPLKCFHFKEKRKKG